MQTSDRVVVTGGERRGRRRFPDEDAFWRGYRAGLGGGAAQPDGVPEQDLDWLAGWIEGAAERGIPAQRRRAPALP